MSHNFRPIGRKNLLTFSDSPQFSVLLLPFYPFPSSNRASSASVAASKSASSLQSVASASLYSEYLQASKSIAVASAYASAAIASELSQQGVAP